MTVRCRARTKKGTLCRRKVSRQGERCYQHRGLLTAPPRAPWPRQAPVRTSSYGQRPTQSRPKRQPNVSREARRAQRRYERVKEAADYCNDVLTYGWRDAVADHAAEYVTEATWNRLFRSRRRRHCKVLAQVAAAILASNQLIQSFGGLLASKLLALVGANSIAQVLARELFERLPLPHNMKIIAVGRGVQITGILLCVVSDRQLTECQCFIDLALAESKTRVKQIIIAAEGDWVNLKDFPPKESAFPRSA
jgi:hypothetical protein